jgi:class 3 adenylate cyclase
VRNTSFVFTDIRGSTAMYERCGDSDAYAIVREHFRILTRVVSEHHGGVVKTIGDAVMATFPVATDAVAAALGAHVAFDAFNRGHEGREISIKIGVHRGPCLAVCSNDRLDYFGRTVNMAARIQGLSQGGDVVLSATSAAAAPVRGLIAASGWRAEPFTAVLKGIGEPCEVVRLER